MFLIDFRKTVKTGMNPPLKTDLLTFLSPMVSRKIWKTREVSSKPRLEITHLQVLSVFQLVKFPTMGRRISVKIPTQGKALWVNFPQVAPPSPTPGLNIDRCINLWPPYWCTTVVHQHGDSIKLRETLQQNHTDLRIGEVIYQFVSYKIPSFWLISLSGFDYIFCCVTVKSICL